MSIEEWRAIPGYPDYEVSNLGQVRSFRLWRGTHGPRVLVQRRNLDGYPTVRLQAGVGSQTEHRVHRLVTDAFIGELPEGMVTRHLNGVHADNRLENLVYGTPQENNLDTIAHGRHHEAARSHCHSGHEYTPENTLRRSDNNGRKCRECERQKAARHNAKRRAA